jgi:hypothetical protein
MVLKVKGDHEFKASNLANAKVRAVEMYEDSRDGRDQK